MTPFKKILHASFWVLFITIGNVSIYAHSKTFFVPRNITTDSTFELALSNYDIYHNQLCESWFNFYATPFYQKSKKGCQLSEYFLRNNTCELTVRENGTGDINSLWFSVIGADNTNFSSLFSIRPTRVTYGADFNLHFPLNYFCNNFWLGIVFAVVHAKHNLHINEQDIVNAGTIPGFANVTQALTNPLYTAGRFYTGNKSRTDIDDIQFKLGYDYFFCDNHIGIYAVGTAPTGKKPRSEFIFEPIVGTRHASAGFGLNGDYLIWHNDVSTLNIMADFKFLHFFSAKERRSFDLLAPNRDWSRYLLVVTQNNPLLTTPAINALTQEVRVQPGNTVQLWTALHYNHCSYNFELGYNLWWRSKEKIGKVNFDSTLGIFDLSGVCGNLASASEANISQGFLPPNIAPNNLIFTPITASQIDVDSAAAPRALTNKIYGAFGYDTIWCNYAVLWGIGGSYEFAHRLGSLEQWALWAKLGIDF